ncbi:MAG: RHS repeat-associated core domain-containing protein, partial [Cyanobacteria bacterium P01_F01_bin.143]
YTRDHLGSIREVIAEDGVTVLARYDYDPYGNVTALSGSPSDSDFLYTGHYYHQPTGLHLALYRAYDAKTGRWLSRDPIPNPEMLPEGPGLYRYVASNPVRFTDPDGRRIGGNSGHGSGRGGTINRPSGPLNVQNIPYIPNRKKIEREMELPPQHLIDGTGKILKGLMKGRDIVSLQSEIARNLCAKKQPILKPGCCACCNVIFGKGSLVVKSAGWSSGECSKVLISTDYVAIQKQACNK